MMIRDKATRLHDTMANIFALLLIGIFAYFIYYVVHIFWMMIMATMGMMSGGGSSGSFDEIWIALVPFFGLILALAIGAVLVSFLRTPLKNWVGKMHETRYQQAASYLHHTDFLRVIAEEDFTQIIIESVNDIPSLKWISPGTPKTLVQQLEFSACYWNSILQLSYGPGRLDNASLFNGSWNYQMSRVSLYACCACCCLSNSMMVFTIPAMIITANYHLWRVARLCCIIDYLSGDRFAENS